MRELKDKVKKALKSCFSSNFNAYDKENHLKLKKEYTKMLKIKKNNYEKEFLDALAGCYTPSMFWQVICYGIAVSL